MTNTVLKPEWAGATLRLDPTRFPQQLTYGKGNGSADVAITLDERGAVQLESCDGEHMQLARDCWEPLVKQYTGSFTEQKVRA